MITNACNCVIVTLLYGQDNHDTLCEITVMCVLDFFVHESYQRTGIGRRLFDAMLRVCMCMHLITCDE